MKERAVAIHNFVNFEKIRALALEEENEIDRTKTVVVSIGRIDYPKHFDIIPRIAARSLKVEFIDENEEVRKKLEGEWTVVFE